MGLQADQDDQHRPAKRMRTSPPPPTASPRSLFHPVQPLASYQQHPTKPPPFGQPLLLTSFSYSPTRELLHSDEALAYYHPPPLGADLNQGFEGCKWRDEGVDEGLDGLLDSLEHYMTSNESGKGVERETVMKMDLITWRGMMTKLLLAAYEADWSINGRGRGGEGWEMNAMVVDGTLYLEQSVTPSSLAEKTSKESSYKLQSYYGYSFESYATTPPSASNSAPLFHLPNTNVQWCAIVKTNLGGLRTCLGGEVDCVTKEAGNWGKERGTKDFVELKTNVVIGNGKDEMMFERLKLLKHYVQSFLLGVPTITVGFRTRPGVLTALQTFKTLEIPRLVRSKPHAWDPTICLSSGFGILEFIKNAVSHHPSTKSHESAFSSSDLNSFPRDKMDAWPVFRITFDGREGVNLRLLDREEVEGDVMGGKRDVEGGRVGFLPASWVKGIWHKRREMSSEVLPAQPAAVPVAKSAPILPGLKR